MTIVLRGLAIMFLMTSGTLAQPTGPVGTWLNQDKDGIVQIGDCGLLRGQPTTGALCGVVAWIRDTVDRATGRPPVDAKNADPALRTRPIMGLPVLLDMRTTSTAGRWDGRLYNIDDGKTYTGKLTLLPDNRLRVEGCVMLICQGETWTRQALPDTPRPRPAGPSPAR
jgi:uncharacterized protein (DUF2147 family)